MTTLLILGGIDCLFNDVLHIHYRTRFRHINEVANRITCVLFQLFITLKTASNFWQHMHDGTLLSSPDVNTREAQDAFIGFFLYDTIKLLSTQRGCKQTLFLVHHIMSLFVLGLNKVYNTGNNGLDNSVIMLLEAASPFLNLSKIAEEAAPLSRSTRCLKIITKLAYIFTRQVCFAAWLVAASSKANMSWAHRTVYASFCLVYAVSLKWTCALLKK